MRHIFACVIFCMAACRVDLCEALQAKDSTNNLLHIIDANGLMRFDEVATTVQVWGSPCQATEFRDVYLVKESSYRLEYSRSYVVNEFSQTCLQGYPPEIDTKLIVVFDDPTNGNTLTFHAQKEEDCDECKPHAPTRISGSITRRGKNQFELTFSGDIVDSMSLWLFEPGGK